MSGGRKTSRIRSGSSVDPVGDRQDGHHQARHHQQDRIGDAQAVGHRGDRHHGDEQPEDLGDAHDGRRRPDRFDGGGHQGPSTGRSSLVSRPYSQASSSRSSSVPGSGIRAPAGRRGSAPGPHLGEPGVDEGVGPARGGWVRSRGRPGGPRPRANAGPGSSARGRSRPEPSRVTLAQAWAGTSVQMSSNPDDASSRSATQGGGRAVRPGFDLPLRAGPVPPGTGRPSPRRWPPGCGGRGCRRCGPDGSRGGRRSSRGAGTAAPWRRRRA